MNTVEDTRLLFPEKEPTPTEAFFSEGSRGVIMHGRPISLNLEFFDNRQEMVMGCPFSIDEISLEAWRDICREDIARFKGAGPSTTNNSPGL